MKNADEIAIETLVDNFVDGWNRGDGEACGKPFAPDADFVAVTGLKFHGRDVIARGHTEILATIFRGSRNSAKVESIRFLRPDVAVADVTFAFLGDDPPFGVTKASCGLVCTKDDGAWQIAVFRNMVPFGRPTEAIERELAVAGK